MTPQTDASFPAIFGAAVVTGGAIALLSQYDRRAAGILATTLLLAIILYRGIPAKVTEFVSAVTGH